MKRRLLLFGFAFGLLLTVAALAEWVRGAWVTDTFRLFRTRIADGVLTSDLGNAVINADRVVVSWDHARARLGPRVDPAIRIPRFEVEHLPVRGLELHRFIPSPDDPLWRRVGFACDYRHRVASGANPTNDAVDAIESTSAWVEVPTWFLVLCCAALTVPFAAALLRARRLRLRHTGGLCPACGYDLRGAAHERCPECGEAVAGGVPV